jgi:hypothetical protein
VAKPVERPRLSLTKDAAPGTALVPWCTLEPAAGGVESVLSQRTEIVPEVGGRSSVGLLKLYGRDQKVLAASPAVGTHRLDRVRARVWIPRFDSLQLRWYRAGVQRGELAVPLFPTPGPIDCEIDIPASTDRAFDRLELVVPGEGPVAIGQIELFELAGEHRLPAPGDAPEFVRLGDDMRPCWGITQARPAEISFATPPDGMLVASAAIPPLMRLDGDVPILAVRILGQPGGLRLHRYPLAEADAASSGWVSVRVPLESQVGQETTVRFTLETMAARDAVCAIAQPQVIHFDESAPTVLLITSDTHRSDHTGFSKSGVRVSTPVLDALAARGVVFTDAWSATNVTIPSHVAMLTGLSLAETRIFDNTDALAANASTLAEAFASAGWATVAAVSAAHLDANWSGLGQGFDRMAVCQPSKRSAGETLAHLERWLPDYRGRPLFVWLHLFDAHTPYMPPEPFNASAWDTSKDPYDPALPEPDPATVPLHLPALRNLDFVRALYGGEVNYLDSELARLLDRARFRDAIVAFTADHGESFGSHGVYWNHGGLYRDRLSVPLVMSWPGAPEGTRVARRVTNTDLGRTLLDLAGLAAVEHPGQDLLADAQDSGVAFALSCFGFSASIAEGDDLLILHLATHTLHHLSPDGLRKRHALELFDIAQDPECSVELSESRHERAVELRQKLIAWLEAGESKLVKRTPLGSLEILEHLTALGYARGTEMGSDSALFPRGCTCEECAKFSR